MMTLNRQKFLRLFSGIGIVLVVLALIGAFVYFRTHANDVAVTASVSIANTPPSAAVFNVQTVPAIVSGGVFSQGSPSGTDLPSNTFTPTAGDTTNTKLYIDGYVIDPDGAADIVKVVGIAKSTSDTLCPSGGSSGSPNLLNDGGFETWSSPSGLVDWTTTTGAGSPTLTQDAANKRSDVYAAKFEGVGGSSPSVLGLQSNVISGKTPGDTATFSGYAKNIGTGTGTGGVFFLNGPIGFATQIYNFNGTPAWQTITSGTAWSTLFAGGHPDYYIAGSSESTSYVNFTASPTIPANGTIVAVVLGAPTSGAFTVYIDDVSLTMSSGGGGGVLNTCLVQSNCTLGGAVYSSGTSSGESNDRSFSCELVVPYYALSGTWKFAIAAWDNSESSAQCPPFYDQQVSPNPCLADPTHSSTAVLFTSGSPTFTMATMGGISGSSSLSYGSNLAKGSVTSNTGYLDRTTTFLQAGNVTEDVNVSSTAAMDCKTGGISNGKTIPVSNQQYSATADQGYDVNAEPGASAFVAGDGTTTMKALSTSSERVFLNIPLTDVTSGSPVNTPGTIYWNIHIPSDAKGTCSGTITASSVAH